MSRRIIIPTDFSEHAGRACHAAVEIGGRMGAELLFLHVLPPGALMAGPGFRGGSGTRAHRNPALAEEAAARLDTLVAMAERQGVKAGSRLLEAERQRHVADAISESGSDLVVVGSRGKGSLDNFILGSNTARILRMCKVPVLVLQKELTPSNLSGPVVFASGLEPDTHAAFDKLLDFSRAMAATPLHFVGITTPNNFRPTAVARKEMDDFLSHHDCAGIQSHIYNHYNVEAGLLEFSRGINAGLIAISNHGRTDLSGLFIESIPENLVRFSDFQVLSIRV